MSPTLTQPVSLNWRGERVCRGCSSSFPPHASQARQRNGGQPDPPPYSRPAAFEQSLSSYEQLFTGTNRESRAGFPAQGPGPGPDARSRRRGARGSPQGGAGRGCQKPPRVSRELATRGELAIPKVMKYLCLLKNKIKQVTPEKTPEVEFRDEPISLTYKGV